MIDCCSQKDTKKVYYNPHNKVVMCHACGHVYTPATRLQYFLNRIFRWWG